ncbi:MAG: Flp family type IVb pilin [Planctomycetes bacterium]|nr:Flp family type IVb pilin [Planctomycetota bacterium]
MKKRILKRLRLLHEDEQGADMIEYVLIVAAVALPILALIIYFKDDLITWVTDQWSNITGRSLP